MAQLRASPGEWRELDSCATALSDTLDEILGGKAGLEFDSAQSKMTSFEAAMLKTILGAIRGSALDDSRPAAELVLLPGDQLPSASAKSVSSLCKLGPVGQALQLGSDVMERFGADQFLERADNTACTLVGAVRLVVSLAHLVGFRQLQGDERLAGRGIEPRDLTAVAIHHAFAALKRSDAQSDAVDRVYAELAVEHARANRLSDDLTHAQLHAQRATERLGPATDEIEQLLDLVKQLRADLKQEQQRNKALSHDNRELRGVVAELEGRSGGTSLQEDQLERLYKFIYRYGRMYSQSDELYQLLRVAAVDDPSAVPEATWVSLALVPDGRIGKLPPEMKKLPHYQPLDVEGLPSKKRPAAPPGSGLDDQSSDVEPASSKKRRVVSIAADAELARRIDARQKKKIIHYESEGSLAESASSSEDDGTVGADGTGEDESNTGDESGGEDESELEGDGTPRTPNASPAPSPPAPGPASAKGGVSKNDRSRARTSSLRTTKVSSSKTAKTSSSKIAKASSSEAAKTSSSKAARSSSRPLSTTPMVPPRGKGKASTSERVSADQPIIHHLPPEVVAECAAKPRRSGNSPLTGRVFKFVDRPVQLGAARGYSSTVPYVDGTMRQRPKVAGVATQSVLQSTFFPNYEVTKGKTKELVGRFGADPYRPVATLLRAAPWETMWTNRARHIYMFDPTSLSRAQVGFFIRVWVFMYRFRREYWTRNHWLALSREHYAGSAQLREYYEQRQAADEVFMRAWRKLRNSAANGLTLLMWSEPAFWYVPDRPCAWVLADVAEEPILDQLEELDNLEPIRAQWTTCPERFAEALIPEQFPFLDAHPDKCWELPSPWDDPNHRPPSQQRWEPAREGSI
jgi:hypothetical protein